MENNYITHTLANGLRIVHLPHPSPIVYCGYQIAAGTRDELPGEEGLAHFVEHVSFKGTSQRTSLEIIRHLECVGGELNAYTNKDTTVYYAAFERQHLERAVDLLSDIVFRSVYPQQEIDKEVEVICDEIELYNDSPAELVYDIFDNTLFAGHPLGHNILGTVDTVRSFTTADAQRFTRKFYRPDNAVFFCYGNVEFEKLVELVEQAQPPALTASLPALPDKREGAAAQKENNNCPTQLNQAPSLLSGRAGGEAFIDAGTHQAHVVLGSVAYPFSHPRRLALQLLNNILGGPGMNNILNIALREDAGLVYTVESSYVCYSDTGVWTIYFGCDPADVDRCLKIVKEKLHQLRTLPLSDEQLASAKTQMKGQIALAADNREAFALDFGKAFLHYNTLKSTPALQSSLNRLTPPDLLHTAQEILDPARLTTLIYK